jgi:hypothetical protein
MNYRIELDKYIHIKETALIGRNNGEYILKTIEKDGIDLSKLESTNEKIIINIPDRIISINKSYFLGLFETIIQRLGKEQFLLKYEFETTNHIKEKIKRHVDSAILKASQGDILDV